jgi:hypothetical protein
MGIMMAGKDLMLGEFGDERLAKRGVCCSRGWWRGRAAVFAVWPAVAGAGLLDFGGFSRTLG